MPIQIQEAGVTDALRGAFKFVGRIAPRLDETISPVAVVADLQRSAAPPIQRSFTAAGTVANVAAQRPFIRMAVPPGMLMVVKRLSVGSDAAGTLTLFTGTIAGPAFTGNLTVGTRDQRNTAPPGVEILTGNQAAALGQTDALLEIPLLPAMKVHDLDLRIAQQPNAPGGTGQLWIIYNALAVSLRASIEWDEFPAATLAP